GAGRIADLDGSAHGLAPDIAVELRAVNVTRDRLDGDVGGRIGDDDIAARGVCVDLGLRAFHRHVTGRAPRDDAGSDRNPDLHLRVADAAVDGLDLERQPGRRQAGSDAPTLRVGSHARFV